LEVVVGKSNRAVQSSRRLVLGQDAYAQDSRARAPGKRFRPVKQRTANTTATVSWKDDQVRDVRVGHLILIGLFGLDLGKHSHESDDNVIDLSHQDSARRPRTPVQEEGKIGIGHVIALRQ
jgi:hypothetical protein